MLFVASLIVCFGKKIGRKRKKRNKGNIITERRFDENQNRTGRIEKREEERN